MDGASFMVNLKTKYIYVDIADDVQTKFNTSNYELDMSLPGEKKN